MTAENQIGMHELGGAGLKVLPMALGCMGMSGVYGAAGARTRRQLSESLAALQVRLSTAEMARIEQCITPEAIAGTRYDERQIRMLDSER
jgi:aryl-alcohol dehydrogenase-like predicted oxidoreductase